MIDAALDRALKDAAALFRRSHYAVALTGAGLSAESGIPTYRGTGGVWTRFGEPTIDGWDLFCQDPEAWWKISIEHRVGGSEFSEAIDRAVPNPAHYAMAELEHMGRLAHVITPQPGDPIRSKGRRRGREGRGTRSRGRCWSGGLGSRLEGVALSTPPPICKECGGVLKNDVVMFGEPIPQDALEECYRQAFKADLFLVVGTSAVVYPAAEFPLMA